MKIFITSRPKLPIRLGFKKIRGEYEDVALHEIPESVIERDISRFLSCELMRIREEYNSQSLDDLQLPTDWPGKHVIHILVHMAVPSRTDSLIPIRIYHLSFRDFLVNPAKRTTNEFWVDEIKYHERITKRCLELMSSGHLTRDICNLKMPGKNRIEVDTTVLATKGSFMDKSDRGITDASKSVCRILLEKE